MKTVNLVLGVRSRWILIQGQEIHIQGVSQSSKANQGHLDWSSAKRTSNREPSDMDWDSVLSQLSKVKSWWNYFKGVKHKLPNQARTPFGLKSKYRRGEVYLGQTLRTWGAGTNFDQCLGLLSRQNLPQSPRTGCRGVSLNFRSN